MNSILPNTILIGVQKAGTSSLSDWLSQHPEVCAPDSLKDYHFFLAETIFQKGMAHLSSFYKDWQNQPVIFHSAVNYIYFPHVAERLYDFNPDLKFILALRDPAKRSFSAHQYFYKKGTERYDFEKALDRERSGKLTNYVDKAHFDYIQHGYYFRQLSMYLKYFKPEQFKIVIYEEMIANPAKTVREVFEFLGIDPGFQPVFSRQNITGMARSRLLNRLVFGDSFIKKIFRALRFNKWIPIQLKTRFANMISKANTNEAKPEKLSRERYHSLIGLYKEDIKEMSRFTGKDLEALWQWNENL